MTVTGGALGRAPGQLLMREHAYTRMHRRTAAGRSSPNSSHTSPRQERLTRQSARGSCRISYFFSQHFKSFLIISMSTYDEIVAAARELKDRAIKRKMADTPDMSAAAESMTPMPRPSDPTLANPTSDSGSGVFSSTGMPASGRPLRRSRQAGVVMSSSSAIASDAANIFWHGSW